MALTASLCGKVNVTQLCVPDGRNCHTSVCGVQSAVAIIRNPGIQLQTLCLIMEEPRR